jgi:hypothetical protein
MGVPLVSPLWYGMGMTDTKTSGRDDIQTPEQVAERFGLPIEWARLHIGDHRCVDGRRYIVSCLVTDPSCDHIARGRMGL